MSDEPKTLPLLPESEIASAREAPAPSQSRGAPRFAKPNRGQLELRSVDLDSAIPEEHVARTLWDFVCRLDLAPFSENVQAREGNVGRDATDPRVLLTLWLYATSEGVGSAREVARLCNSDDAYRWICGGVTTNYHTLSDFRVGHAKALDELMSQILATMMRQGLVSLHRVAQDGTRVRAHAGAASFRRERTLRQFVRQAKEHIEAVKKQAEDVSLRQAKARERAAKERAERLEQALAEMPNAIESKKAGEEEKARVSTTDPDARVMKMADGGFRPAFNIQFATTTVEGIIVGVDATNVGSDSGQLKPMLDQVVARTGNTPDEWLADGGYVNRAAITEADARGATVYMPTMNERSGKPIVKESKRGDTPAVARWRQRMETDEAKLIYRERAATAELVNAVVKHQQRMNLLVRGVEKVRCIALLHAITHNLKRWAKLSRRRP